MCWKSIRFYNLASLIDDDGNFLFNLWDSDFPEGEVLNSVIQFKSPWAVMNIRFDFMISMFHDDSQSRIVVINTFHMFQWEFTVCKFVLNIHCFGRCITFVNIFCKVSWYYQHLNVCVDFNYEYIFNVDINKITTLI